MLKRINYISHFFFIVFVLGQASIVFSFEGDLVDELLLSADRVIEARIIEPSEFYGLASYYNSRHVYIVNSNRLYVLEDEVVTLEGDQWLSIVGRFNVLLIKADGLTVRLNGSVLTFDNPQVIDQSRAIVKIVDKSRLISFDPVLDQIRYAHLWPPLAQLAKLVEFSLVWIQANVVSGWGLAIIVFGVFLKLLLLPIGVMTVRFQRRVSQVQAQLEPRLADIKANYDGEEAHNCLMASYKELGVSPFYTLKPMLGSLIQIPILIAVFNALGEMPQLNGQSFLWIDNLAYPDFVYDLSFAVPLFGSHISMLPVIMTVVTVFSTIIFQNKHASAPEIKRQKRNLFLMAVAFFVLFYPFPAAMVLYWVLANILQTFQQQLVKI